MWLAALLCGGAAHAELPDGMPPVPRGCDGGLLRGLARPLVDDRVALRSSVRPLVVWYTPTHPNSVEIAPVVLAALEEAWALQVDVLGFRPPVLPDVGLGPELDVYLNDYERWSAYVAADTYADNVAGDGYNGTSAYMVIDRRLPAEAVASYTAHEFNHVVQFATDFSEPTLPIWEATATAAQKWTHGDDGTWTYDVPSFQEAPMFSVLTADGYGTYYDTGLGYTYEYGAALWVVFLDEKYDVGEGFGGVALWEAAANEGTSMEPDVVEAFATVTGLPLGEALGELAVVRFLTGADWDERGLADAADWGTSKAVPAEHTTGSTLPWDAPLSPRPRTLGQGFLDVDLTDLTMAPDDAVHVSASSAAYLDSGIAVLWWAGDGTAGHDVAWGPTPAVEVPSTGLVRVVVALTNLGPSGWDGEDDPYFPGDQVLHVSIGPASVDPTPPPDPLDTGGEPDDLPVEAVEPGELGGSGSCGCRAAPVEVAWATWWVVPAFLVRRRRRR